MLSFMYKFRRVCKNLKVSTHKQQKGFTLMELLVVISIIALLLAILMPTLQKAKELARRTVCLSNQRQNGISLYQYASAWDDRLPPMVLEGPGRGLMNASHSFFIEFMGPGQWVGVGRLYGTGIITDPKHLYCPSQRSKFFSYPEAWDNFVYPDILQSRICGYFYRIFDQPNPPIIPQAEVDYLNNLRYSTMKRTMALTADIFGTTIWQLADETWPHQNPLGVNAAYSDGHAKWVRVDEKERRRAIVAADKYKYGSDDYCFLFFQALDDGDFSELEKAFHMW